MIVTEYGVAQMFGKPISERAKQLISIAHPKFREELTFEAKKMVIFSMEPLNVVFFNNRRLELARQLLGNYIVHEQPSGLIIGRIVETEAYMGPDDRAAHSFGNRRTKRTEIMFGEPGLIIHYQMHTHTLINVVSAPADIPNAILIRAVEPIEGLELNEGIP